MRPYEKRTRKTTPNVYNTSSITTALYHGVGDTKMESYTYQNQNRNQNRNQNPNQNYTSSTRYRHFSLTTSQSLSLPSFYLDSPLAIKHARRNTPPTPLFSSRVDDDFDSAHSFSKQQQKRIRVIHCASCTFRNEEKHFTFPRLGETNLVVDDEG